MSDEPKKVFCTRREVAEQWCEENDATIEDMSDEQSFRLRALPAWLNAP